jgi:hypothetical protein
MEPVNPQAAIALRALRDDRFREELLRAPAATLEREFGVKVPDGVTLQVHEETDTLVHLIVPGRPSKLEKLSDGDLEMLPTDPRATTKCCTCGSSTDQTLITLGCNCD